MPSSFTDGNGRSWAIAIHIGSLRRVEKALGIKLASLAEDRAAGLAELLRDPVKLIDVIFVLCQEQAQAANVSDVSFGEAMHGDGLERATDAFLQAWCEFFPKEKCSKLKEALDQGRALTGKLLDRADALLADIDLDAEADRIVAELKARQ